MSEEEIKAMQEENAKFKADLEASQKKAEEFEQKAKDFESKYNDLIAKNASSNREGAPLPEGESVDELFGKLFNFK